MKWIINFWWWNRRKKANTLFKRLKRYLENSRLQEKKNKWLNKLDNSLKNCKGYMKNSKGYSKRSNMRFSGRTWWQRTIHKINQIIILRNILEVKDNNRNKDYNWYMGGIINILGINQSCFGTRNLKAFYSIANMPRHWFSIILKSQ